MQIVQLELPIKGNWDLSFFDKLNPEEIELSFNPSSFEMDEVVKSRLPLGTVLSFQNDGINILLDAKVTDDFLENSLFENPSAVLCCANLGIEVDDKDSQVTMKGGNFLFMYWGNRVTRDGKSSKIGNEVRITSRNIH